MDTIIIAGGRGRRLGCLTSRHNKGALRFQGVPVLARLIKSLCQTSYVNRIHVVTGYQPESIEQVLHNIPLQEYKRVNTVRAPSETIGMLQRIAQAMPSAQCEPGALVMGVDSLITAHVMNQFMSRITSRVAQGNNVITLLCATDPEPAPTHYLLSEAEGRVMKHVAPENADASCTLRSIGVRYLPGHILRKIWEDAPQWHGKNISPYITHLMSAGTPVHALATSAPWIHIGYPRDFEKADPEPK